LANSRGRSLPWRARVCTSCGTLPSPRPTRVIAAGGAGSLRTGSPFGTGHRTDLDETAWHGSASLDGLEPQRREGPGSAGLTPQVVEYRVERPVRVLRGDAGRRGPELPSGMASSAPYGAQPFEPGERHVRPPRPVRPPKTDRASWTGDRSQLTPVAPRTRDVVARTNRGCVFPATSRADIPGFGMGGGRSPSPMCSGKLDWRRPDLISVRARPSCRRGASCGRCTPGLPSSRAAPRPSTTGNGRQLDLPGWA